MRGSLSQMFEVGLGVVNFRYDFYVKLRCIVNRAVQYAAQTEHIQDERNVR